MARGRKKDAEASFNLDLAPIMNMVVILIPLLLLSIVFLKVGVINITAPKLSMGPPSEEQPVPDELPLDLTIAVNAAGFQITAQNASLPPIGGCPTPGPTICLTDPQKDVNVMFDAARSKIFSGNTQAGEKELHTALASYNWIGLYNQLVSIKGKFPKETTVNITGDANIPYALIVRIMDMVRYKLEKDTYKDASEFFAAKPRKTGNKYDELFYDPILSLPKG